jgi:hypothetical protein
MTAKTFWIEHKDPSKDPTGGKATVELFVGETRVGAYHEHNADWFTAEKLFSKVAKAVGAKVKHL